MRLDGSGYDHGEARGEGWVQGWDGRTRHRDVNVEGDMKVYD